MKDTIKKLEELNTQRYKIINQLEKEFNSTLKQVFVDNPTLEKIDIYINNHEFNDGGATSFYIGYEDLKIVVEGEEVEREWDNKTKEYVENPLLESLIELFGDTQCIHEDLYGDEYEHLSITREDVLNY
jgi:hypothetical protein